MRHGPSRLECWRPSNGEAVKVNSTVETDRTFQLLADAVLCLHVLVVLFVGGGLVLVLAGNAGGRRWPWVNRWWFRLAHLSTIAVVVAQSWLGITCPLTTLEIWLRAQGHAAIYAGSFLEHWLQHLLYYTAAWWVFALAYTLFGVLVVATWWIYPPMDSAPAGDLCSRQAGPILRTETRDTPNGSLCCSRVAIQLRHHQLH